MVFLMDGGGRGVGDKKLMVGEGLLEGGVGGESGSAGMQAQTMWQSGHESTVMRVTRNHVLSGAQVRILASSESLLLVFRLGFLRDGLSCLQLETVSYLNYSWGIPLGSFFPMLILSGARFS